LRVKSRLFVSITSNIRPITRRKSCGGGALNGEDIAASTRVRSQQATRSEIDKPLATPQAMIHFVSSLAVRAVNEQTSLQVESFQREGRSS